MVRNTDVTGFSGTGVVAEGIQFTDGSTVIRWCAPGKPSSTVTWDNITDAMKVHGHDGSTQLVWLEDVEAAVNELDITEWWIIPKRPAPAGWVEGGRVALTTPLNEDYFTPGDARLFACDYLAAADEAERAS